ncbi:MAG: methyltransferase [Pseudomonadota bacterium]
MTDIGHPNHAGPTQRAWQRLAQRFHDWRLQKIASPAFQRWAAGFRLTRPFVRQDSARLYDLVAGFVYSQTLLACTELGLLETLRSGPMAVRALAARHGLPEARMATLCQSAAAIGLLVPTPGGYRLGRLGAAALGVPGLSDMIRHHKIFYRDLADPVALLKDAHSTELSRYWTYVPGSETAGGSEEAAEYSHLMAISQALVAEETLDAASLGGARALMDVGGGTGVFLDHVGTRYPDLDLRLFDLPPVIDAARARMGSSDRIALSSGSFLDDELPRGADTISLIRVCYDHDDAVVVRLLRRVFAALPPGGRILVSEPMSGGDRPCRAGDAYFGFYTLAMTSGRPRSAEQHKDFLREAGFTGARRCPTRRPFLTSVVMATKPGS